MRVAGNPIGVSAEEVNLVVFKTAVGDVISNIERKRSAFCEDMGIWLSIIAAKPKGCGVPLK